MSKFTKVSNKFWRYAFTFSEILTFSIFYLQKVGQCQRVQFFTMAPFDGKFRFVQTSFFTFWIFAKVRPVRMKVTQTHTHTHTHTHTETDKPIAMDEFCTFAYKTDGQTDRWTDGRTHTGCKRDYNIIVNDWDREKSERSPKPTFRKVLHPTMPTPLQ